MFHSGEIPLATLFANAVSWVFMVYLPNGACIVETGRTDGVWIQSVLQHSSGGICL